MELPDDCPTPDGMAIAPNGDLILACPNFADLSKPACLMRITKDGKISKWMNVPILEETGWLLPWESPSMMKETYLFVTIRDGAEQKRPGTKAESYA